MLLVEDVVLKVELVLTVELVVLVVDDVVEYVVVVVVELIRDTLSGAYTSKIRSLQSPCASACSEGFCRCFEV